jgi:hypothetical protein
MLSTKEILKKLGEQQVDMGKTPARTFNYYRQIGLLPRPQEVIRREAYYEDSIVEDIKLIRELVKEGKTLEWIKGSTWVKRRVPQYHLMYLANGTVIKGYPTPGSPEFTIEVRRNGVFCECAFGGELFKIMLTPEEAGQIFQEVAIRSVKENGHFPRDKEIFLQFWRVFKERRKPVKEAPH